ncbi:S-layer homology domain-containing protein [Clostridiaceae bacterium 35-E11]
MRKKKFLTVFLILALVLGMVVPAFAANEDNGLREQQAKITKNKAKEIAETMLKTYFDTDVNEKKFETSIEFRQDYEHQESYVWEIRWNMHTMDKNMNIRVAVDGNTGKVVRVNKYEYTNGEKTPRIATITEQQAKQIAERFIQKVNPEEYKEAKLQEDGLNKYPYGSYRPVNYHFRYLRIINGLNFDRNYIAVEVDGEKGKITGYSYQWNKEIKNPSPDAVIKQEEAEKIFKEEVTMGLQYIPYHQNDYERRLGATKAKLIYMPQFNKGNMLDAKEGKMLDWAGRTEQDRKTKDLTAKQKQEIFEKAEPIKVSKQEISKERATEVMNTKIKEIFGKDYELEQVRYVENDNYWETSGQQAWSAQFRNTAQGASSDDGGSVVINALTEQLISIDSHYWPDRDDEVFEPKLTWEEAYDEAVKVIAQYFPQNIKAIDTEQTYVAYPRVINGKEVPQRFYYFNFPRIVNGIIYRDDNISVEIDVKTGKIRGIRKMWNHKVDFPSPKKVMDAKEAQKRLLDTYQPELVYTMINQSNDIKKPNMEVKLVYRLKATTPYYAFMNMDAFTGKFVTYNGEEIDEQQDQFQKKIQGHSHQKELSILASQGIIDTKSFEVDKEITRIEAIKMLVKGKGDQSYRMPNVEILKFSDVPQDTPDYKQLQLAVNYGILENKKMTFKPDEKITREEMAEMLVRLLQYDKLAKAKNIYALLFADRDKVSGDKIGYVAICKGLQIIEGTNGLFRPQDHATMGEMAVAVYKALENMKDSND